MCHSFSVGVVSTGERDVKAAAVKLFSDVRDVLWDNWDPIGMGREYLPADEYDSYIEPICSILVDPKATPSDLIAYLSWAESGMNLAPDLRRIKRAADCLLAMRPDE